MFEFINLISWIIKYLKKILRTHFRVPLKFFLQKVLICFLITFLFYLIIS
jgi:hypothetical protein